MDAIEEDGGQATEEPDLAVERLVERGPEMFMDPAEEESARKVALEESVTDAVAQGLSVSKAERLRGILSHRFNAFRRALRGDPPARVEPMRVQLGVRGEGQAEAVRSREDELVGVVRGGSVGVRARVPEPAGGMVQSGDGCQKRTRSAW